MADETARQIAHLRKLCAEAADRLRGLDDMGPLDEGFKSDELRDLIGQLEEAARG